MLIAPLSSSALEGGRQCCYALTASRISSKARTTATRLIDARFVSVRQRSFEEYGSSVLANYGS